VEWPSACNVSAGDGDRDWVQDQGDFHWKMGGFALFYHGKMGREWVFIDSYYY
jgi:hypothetical protein